MLCSETEGPPPCHRRISFKGTPSEEQVRETSVGLLTGYLGPLVDAIVGSVPRCPHALRLAFKQLQCRVEEHFPGAEHEVGRALGRGAVGRWCQGHMQSQGRDGTRSRLPRIEHCVPGRSGAALLEGLGPRVKWWWWW
jgi:hypothetical protein